MKKGLNKEQVLKRLTNAEKKHIKNETKYYKEYKRDESLAEFLLRNQFRPEMKYFTRLHMFKGSNYTFNPQTLIADSYNWWIFVMVLKGKLVFNDYRYSNSTSGHAELKLKDWHIAVPNTAVKSFTVTGDID